MCYLLNNIFHAYYVIGLGLAATISAVLYANTNHPEWKSEFPNWVDRCKQILKKWRALLSEQKAPYLQRARENRSAIKMKKAQQVRPLPCQMWCVLTQLTYHCVTVCPSHFHNASVYFTFFSTLDLYFNELLGHIM